jgi:hypothetical protein
MAFRNVQAAKLTAHTVVLWTAWAFFTFGWNGVNTLNSVGEELFFALAKYLDYFRYKLSLHHEHSLVGNLLLTARTSLPYAVVAYGILSTTGNVMGQKLALRWKANNQASI